MSETKKNKNELTFDDKIEKLAEAMAAGDAAYIRAGKIVAELIDEDGFAYTTIALKCPALGAQALRTLYRIGKGTLIPSLFIASNPGDRMLKGMTIEMQKEFGEEGRPIPVVVQGEKPGEFELTHLKAQDLTRDQTYQVAMSDGTGGKIFRTPAQQEAHLADKISRSNQKSDEVSPKWYLDAGNIVIPRGTVLTPEESLEAASAGFASRKLETSENEN